VSQGIESHHKFAKLRAKRDLLAIRKKVGELELILSNLDIEDKEVMLNPPIYYLTQPGLARRKNTLFKYNAVLKSCETVEN